MSIIHHTIFRNLSTPTAKTCRLVWLSVTNVDSLRLKTRQKSGNPTCSAVAPQAYLIRIQTQGPFQSCPLSFSRFASCHLFFSFLSFSWTADSRKENWCHIWQTIVTGDISWTTDITCDYFNNVLSAFLGLEHGSCVALYAGSESSQISSKI